MDIFGFINAHGIVLLICWYVLSNAVSSLPAPDSGSSKGYVWLFKFSNGIAGNLKSVLADHSLIPAAKTTIK